MLYRAFCTLNINLANPTVIPMNVSLKTLLNDEAGFVATAELVLISTILVIGLIAGLSEVSWNVNNELKDCGRAFSHMNQTYAADGSRFDDDLGFYGASGGY